MKIFKVEKPYKVQVHKYIIRKIDGIFISWKDFVTFSLYHYDEQNIICLLQNYF